MIEDPPLPSKVAFEEFYQQPLIRLSVSQLQGDSDFKYALFWNAFVAGCKYATDRCDAEHHNLRRAEEDQAQEDHEASAEMGEEE